jgi:hypothetical protein
VSFTPRRHDGYSLQDITVNLLKDKPKDTVISYPEGRAQSAPMTRELSNQGDAP